MRNFINRMLHGPVSAQLQKEQILLRQEECRLRTDARRAGMKAKASKEQAEKHCNAGDIKRSRELVRDSLEQSKDEQEFTQQMKMKAATQRDVAKAKFLAEQARSSTRTRRCLGKAVQTNRSGINKMINELQQTQFQMRDVSEQMQELNLAEEAERDELADTEVNEMMQSMIEKCNASSNAMPTLNMAREPQRAQFAHEQEEAAT